MEKMNSLDVSPLVRNSHPTDVSMEDLIPKKVCFRDESNSMSFVEPVEKASIPKMSWKEKLVDGSSCEDNGLEEQDDFEILEGDIHKSLIHGTPSIKFPERINQILIRDMENTVIIKLLGMNIGFVALQSKIYSL